MGSSEQAAEMDRLVNQHGYWFKSKTGDRPHLDWEKMWGTSSTTYGNYYKPIPTRPFTYSDVRDALWQQDNQLTSSKYGSFPKNEGVVTVSKRGPDRLVVTYSGRASRQKSRQSSALQPINEQRESASRRYVAQLPGRRVLPVLPPIQQSPAESVTSSTHVQDKRTLLTSGKAKQYVRNSCGKFLENMEDL